MGEPCCEKEKELNAVLNLLLRYGESRSRLINSIESAIERISPNWEGKEPAPDKRECELKKPDSFMTEIQSRLNEIDMDNERLAMIEQKLNSLI